MSQNTNLSPQGIAIFPNLRKPEIFENKEVGYTVKLHVSEEVAQKFKQHLIEEIKRQQQADPKLRDKQFNNPIIPVVQDKEGKWLIKFKSKAEYKNQKGERVLRKISIYDANLDLLDESIDVAYGSTIIVSYKPYVYNFNNASQGIKLLIEAVQVIKLVEKNADGTKTASSYGFRKQYEDDPYQ